LAGGCTSTSNALRDWREDFAQLMREQGIAANATPRAIRGETISGSQNHKKTRGLCGFSGSPRIFSDVIGRPKWWSRGELNPRPHHTLQLLTKYRGLIVT
jgi:hypothetical protein